MGDSRESALDRIRRRRDELAAERHHDADLPGYGGAVVLRFGAVSWEQIQEIGARAQKDKGERRLLNAQADLLITACREVLVRVDEELVPIDDPGPVRFDQHLADALGLEPGERSARAVLFEAFELANAPDVAIAAMSAEVQQWMGESDGEIDQVLLGE